MKNRIKEIIAFTALVIVVLAGLILPALDRKTDVYPGEDTKIRLYGEAHGVKTYYDIEINLWKNYYDDGYRALFVELPYYTAGSFPSGCPGSAGNSDPILRTGTC